MGPINKTPIKNILKDILKNIIMGLLKWFYYGCI